MLSIRKLPSKLLQNKRFISYNLLELNYGNQNKENIYSLDKSFGIENFNIKKKRYIYHRLWTTREKSGFKFKR